MEQDEIREKAKRRSSILKTPKARNPFEEIDVTETCAENSMMKPARRVSFASSNYIKQFTVDPEKVTIWDTTYEEDVNHTNSTQSSREQLVTTSTKLEQFTEMSTFDDVTTNVVVQDMELTQQSFFVDKENIPYCHPPKISIIDYAKRISSSPVSSDLVSEGRDEAAKSEQHILDTNGFCHKMQKHKNSVENNENLEFTGMDFTCQVSTTMSEMKTNVSVQHDLMDADMEFTCQVPKLAENNTSLDMDVTCNSSQNSTNIEAVDREGIVHDVTKMNDDLEFTCQATTKDLNFVKPPECTNDFQAVNSETDIEFTCQAQMTRLNVIQLPGQTNASRGLELIPKMPVPSNTSSVENQSLKTDDMDISYQEVPDLNLVKSLIKPDLTAISVNTKIASKMPDINSKVDYNSSKSNDMEYTCQATRDFVKSQVSVDMESTCQAQMKNMNFVHLPAESNITTNTSLGMEFTRKMPLCNVTQSNIPISAEIQPMKKGNITYQEEAPQNLNFVKSLIKPDLTARSVDTEFASEMPEVISKVNHHSSKSNDMEFTCQATATDFVKSSVSFDMEFTCQAKMKDMNFVHIPAETNITTNTSLDMEFTSKMPLCNVTQSNIPISAEIQPMKKDITQQESNFIKSPAKTDLNTDLACEIFEVKNVEDQSLKSTDMEFTCQVPVQNENLVKSTKTESNSKYLKLDESRENNKTNCTDLNFSKMNFTKIEDMSYQSSLGTNPRKDLKFGRNLDFTNPNNDLTCQSSLLKLRDETALSCSGTSVKKDIIKVPKVPQHELKRVPIRENKQEPSLISECSFPLNKTNMLSKIDTSIDFPSLPLIHQSKSLREYSIMEIDESCNTQSRIQMSNENQPKSVRNYLTSQKDIFCDELKSQFEESTQFSFFDPVKHGPQNNCPTPLKTDGTSKIPVRKQHFSNNIDSKSSRIFQDCELSACRTPDPSFHINLTNFSSGLDDTDQLLQCTYSKPSSVSFMISDPEEKNENLALNLVSIMHISKPHISDSLFEGGLETGKQVSENSPDISLYELPRNRLAATNDTYVLKNKTGSDKSIGQDVVSTPPRLVSDDDSVESSIGVLNEYDMDLEMESVEVPKIELELKKCDVKIKRVSEISDLLVNVTAQRNQIFNYLQNFSFKPFEVPELVETEKISRDSIESVEETNDENKDFCPTMEVKIKDHQKSCQNCWKLETTHGFTHHFSTLFGTLGFVVEVDVASNKVMNIQTFDKLADTSEPLARFVLKSFQNKLNNDHIKSALGESYDILSLLDYVKMTMLRFHSFQREFLQSKGLAIDEDFRAVYTVRSLPLVCSFKILVDVNNLEHLNYETDIHLKSEIGTVNENEIKKLAENCQKDLDFFVSFLQKIQEYISVKEKRKILLRMKEL